MTIAVASMQLTFKIVACISLFEKYNSVIGLLLLQLMPL